jgi:Zn-dependent protease
VPGLTLSPEVLQRALLFIAALVVSTCFHEFGHAFVADRLGDRLPRLQKRVTLSPLAHVDPIGTLLFPLLLLLGSGGHTVFGWGKPVRTHLTPAVLPRGLGLRTARLLVSIAGPTMNLLLAVLLSAVFVAADRAGQPQIADFVAGAIQLNIVLCVFNLIPIPPLDGRSILFWFLPEDHPAVRALERYGSLLFVGLLFLPRILSVLMLPASWLWGEWSAALHSLSAGP